MVCRTEIALPVTSACAGLCAMCSGRVMRGPFHTRDTESDELGCQHYGFLGRHRQVRQKNGRKPRLLQRCPPPPVASSTPVSSPSTVASGTTVPVVASANATAPFANTTSKVVPGYRNALYFTNWYVTFPRLFEAPVD